MRNRLIVLAAGLVFAASVVAVAVIPGDSPALEKLPVAAAGGGGAETRSAGGAQADSLASSLGAPGTVEYRVKGTLTEPAGPAPAFRLAAATTPAKVAELAAILGVNGPVQETAERFVVRGKDRQVTVEKVAGLPWYLGVACGDTGRADEVVSSDGTMSKCAAASVVRADAPATAIAVDGGGSTGFSGSGPAPEAVPCPTAGCTPHDSVVRTFPPSRPGPCPPDVVCPAPPPAACPPDAECVEPAFPVCLEDTKCEFPSPVPLPEPVRPADLPTRAEAEAKARALFTKLGTGLDRFEISDGFDAWYANVQPRIAGLPTTDRSTSVAIGPKGAISYANGFLAVPERMGDYPLAGTAVGLERLKATAAEGGWFPYATDQPLALGAPEIADCSSATVICDPPSPGVDLPTATPAPVRSYPVGETQVVNLVGVHLGLQQLDDRLVPVYVFEIEGGGETYGVPAVVEELLEKPAQ